MGHHYGTTGMWYKNGIFYELDDTHVNFLLNYPEKLGFTQTEKEEMCVANGLPPDATECLEGSQERVDMILEVLKRGAIRIRFYGGKTSVQCYDHNNKKCFRELQNCIIDGYGKCFGNIITVMDCFGWGEMINDMGWGTQIKDFIASSLHKPNYHYITSMKEGYGMNGYDRNDNSIDNIFNDKKSVYDCIVNNKYVSIKKLIESNIRLYDLIKGKHAENGYVIISACRDSSNKSKSVQMANMERTKELKTDIRKSMYSYMPVFGGYVEEDNGEVLERSFIVFNYDRLGNVGAFEDLKRFAIEMCGKYNQDSVLICEPGEVPKYYDRTGRVVSSPKDSSRNVKVNDMEQDYFTEFKNKSKRYTYDISFPDSDDEVTSSLAKILSGYDYFARPPETYGERYRRSKLGEKFV